MSDTILLTVKQLSKKLGISTKIIYQWTKDERIPFINISKKDAKLKHYRYILDDVIKTLKQTNNSL